MTIEAYLAELRAELRSAGVRGRAGARVVLEVGAHVRDDAAKVGEAEAVRRCGEPWVLAYEVAAELARARTRLAGLAGFSALAVSGLAYLGVTWSIGRAGGWPDIFSAEHEAIGIGSALGIVVFPQIAFVAGCLALWGALRLGPHAGAAELALLRRRSALGVGMGALTLAALALWAVEFRSGLSAWWLPTALVSCAAGATVLALAAAVAVRSAVPAARPGGHAATFGDELAPALDRVPALAPLDPRDHPWRFAGAVAAAVAILAFASGWIGEGIPGDGIVRGLFEGVAVLVCFAALGRVLGLRR